MLNKWGLLLLNLKYEHKYHFNTLIIIQYFRDAWLAQLQEHVTLDLRELSSSPMLGMEPIFKNFKKERKKEKIIIQYFKHEYKKTDLERKCIILKLLKFTPKPADCMNLEEDKT